MRNFLTCLLTLLSSLTGSLWFSNMALAARNPSYGLPAYKEVQAQVKSSGPMLLFSDSPEQITKEGILFNDRVQGHIRIFLHHQNILYDRVKLAVILRAPAGSEAKVTLGKKGVGNPSTDVFAAAKDSQKKYFSQEPFEEKTILLQDYQHLELLTGSNKATAGWIVKPEELVTGYLEFQAANPVLVTIVACQPPESSVEAAEKMPLLPMDEHPLRGYYPKADLTYTIPQVIDLDQGQVYGLTLAQDNNYYLQGKDPMMGKATRDFGNYGVIYTVKYKVKSSRPYSLSLNPAGGEFAGVGLLQDKDTLRLIGLPKGRNTTVGKHHSDALYTFANYKGSDEIQVGRFIWSPPGASCLPIKILWRQQPQPKQSKSQPSKSQQPKSYR